jgi:hypothetical protein
MKKFDEQIKGSFVSPACRLNDAVGQARRETCGESTELTWRPIKSEN